MAEDREYGLDEMPENMETEEGGADLLQIYLDEVNAVPELSEEEEEQLVRAARAGPFLPIQASASFAASGSPPSEALPPARRLTQRDRMVGRKAPGFRPRSRKAA